MMKIVYLNIFLYVKHTVQKTQNALAISLTEQLRLFKLKMIVEDKIEETKTLNYTITLKSHLLPI